MGSLKKREKTQLIEKMIQFNTTQVDNYRSELQADAKRILTEEIPSQLKQLEDILESNKVRSSYQGEARQFSISSIADFKLKLEEQAEANKGKEADIAKALEMLFGKPKAAEESDDKIPSPSLSTSVSAKNSTLKLSGKKRDNTGIVLENKNSNVSVELKLSDSASKMAMKKASLKALELEEEEDGAPAGMPEIESNECVLDLFMELKPLIRRLGETCMLLRNWITLLIPKAEDGNNFGVEVQEQCLVKLVEVEKDMHMMIEIHAGYHLERSHILGKLITCPDIQDYSQYIYDADERQCRKLQDSAHKLRSHYNTVYRTLTNNYDKITAPRGINNNCMHLY